MASPYRAAAAPAFSAVPLGQRKAPRRQHVRRQHLGVVAQAAATAEAALKETDLHDDLKKALANVKPKVSNLSSCHPAPVRSHDLHRKYLLVELRLFFPMVLLALCAYSLPLAAVINGLSMIACRLRA